MTVAFLAFGFSRENKCVEIQDSATVIDRRYGIK